MESKTILQIVVVAVLLAGPGVGPNGWRPMMKRSVMTMMLDRILPEVLYPAYWKPAKPWFPWPKPKPDNPEPKPRPRPIIPRPWREVNDENSLYL